MSQLERPSYSAPEWDIEEARRIVQSMLAEHEVDVYLFGSAANGNMTDHSDIDIAVLAKEGLPAGLLAQIRDALDQSNILYPIDLVYLNDTSADFKAKVLQQGKSWNA